MATTPHASRLFLATLEGETLPAAQSRADAAALLPAWPAPGQHVGHIVTAAEWLASTTRGLVELLERIDRAAKEGDTLVHRLLSGQVGAEVRFASATAERCTLT